MKQSSIFFYYFLLSGGECSLFTKLYSKFKRDFKAREINWKINKGDKILSKKEI